MIFLILLSVIWVCVSLTALYFDSQNIKKLERKLADAERRIRELGGQV